MNSKLGKGAFSEVRQVLGETGEIFAMKIINKAKLKSHRLGPRLTKLD